MRILRFLCQLALVGAAFHMTGCASVSVKDIARADGPARPPNLVIVLPFTVDATNVKEHPSRKNPGKLTEEAQQMLQAFTCSELRKLGLDVTVGAGKPSGNTWVVSGRITRIEEGSRFLRMGIGLGAGGTKMESVVSVFSVGDTQPFLRFSTTGGSGAMPGAATTPIPFTGLPAALSSARDGVTADAARTARMIAAAVGDYMVRQGWLAKVPEKMKVR